MRSIMPTVSALTIVAFLLNGCSSWRNVSVADLEEYQDEVRVHLVGGSHVYLHHVTVGNDSLFGTIKQDDSGKWDRQVAYSMDHVLEIQRQETDTLKMVALMGGVVLLGALVVGAIVVASTDFSGLDWGGN